MEDKPESAPNSPERSSLEIELDSWWKKRLPVEDKIRNSFDKLIEIAGEISQNPDISSLVDYAKKSQERINGLSEHRRVEDSYLGFYSYPANSSGVSAEHLISEIKESNEITPIAQGILLQLRRETTYLKLMDELGIVDYLTNSDTNKVGNTRVFVTRPKRSGFLKYQEGTAYQELDLVELGYEARDYIAMLRNLALFGRLNRGANILMHEMIHVKQGSDFFDIFRPGERVEERELLGEIHAWDAELHSPSCGYRNEPSRFLIGHEVFDSYQGRFGTLSDGSWCFISNRIFNLFHTLRVFGYPESKFIEIVRKGRLDPKTNSIPLLDSEMDVLVEKLGINPELWPVVVSAMFAKYELERRINIKRAVEITQQELLIATGRKSWVKSR